MHGPCPQCNAQLEESWRFCPHCGVAAAAEVLPPAPLAVAENAQKTPVRGAFAGLLFGVVTAPILIIVGTLLCLTGLGAILGVPLIVGAVLAPLLGPLAGIGELKGKCPWCQAPVSSILKVPGFDCHSCGSRIAIQGRKFVRAG